LAVLVLVLGEKREPKSTPANHSELQAHNLIIHSTCPSLPSPANLSTSQRGGLSGLRILHRSPISRLFLFLLPLLLPPPLLPSLFPSLSVPFVRSPCPARAQHQPHPTVLVAHNIAHLSGTTVSRRGPLRLLESCLQRLPFGTESSFSITCTQHSTRRSVSTRLRSLFTTGFLQ
jgi:hypothetical protein